MLDDAKEEVRAGYAAITANDPDRADGAATEPAYRSNASLVPNDEQAALGAIRGAIITDEFQGQGVAELTPKAARITAVDFQHVDSR